MDVENSVRSKKDGNVTLKVIFHQFVQKKRRRKNVEMELLNKEKSVMTAMTKKEMVAVKTAW